LNALCRLRNTLDAFNGEFSCTADGERSITLNWTAADGASTASLNFELSRGLGVDSAASVVSLTWTDAAGEHRSDDLIADPPTV
jgi:sucrose phosphorylase